MTTRIKLVLAAGIVGLFPLLALIWLAPAASADGVLAGSSKTVDRGTAAPGQLLSYTITVSNTGGSVISDTVVTDTLPAHLTFADGTLTATSGEVGITDQVITWTGSVSPASIVLIQFSATIALEAAISSTITNTAQIVGGGDSLEVSAATGIVPNKVYLPLALDHKLPAGIQGHVTANGAPAAGVSLELRHFNGSGYSTQASTSTDANGYYNFDSAPSLPGGQFYYVLYLNPGGDSSRLSGWGTAEIDNFVAGSTVLAGDFDLANVSLAMPAPGATVGLPALFEWTRRPATPSDSYQLSLFDPTGSAFGQTDPLGYVNGVMLGGVPSEFHTGHTYGWFVAINSPDGGYGESYYYREIRFSSLLVGNQPSVDGAVSALPVLPHADAPRPRGSQ